jgi:hypothetical protein
VVVAGGFDGVVDFGGGNRTSAGSNDIFVAKFGGSVTAVGDAPRTAGLSLSSFPNPLRSETTIRFTVPSAGRVTVEVYDIRGARIATLVDERMNAGAHAIAWNRRDARARDAGPGVYLARVRQPRGTTTCRMIVLR